MSGSDVTQLNLNAVVKSMERMGNPEAAVNSCAASQSTRAKAPDSPWVMISPK
jgi:hypothetical protein